MLTELGGLLPTNELFLIIVSVDDQIDIQLKEISKL